MCPFLEIWAAPCGLKGLVTEDTWPRGASAAAILSVRSRLVGSVKGPVVVMTTWAGLPEKDGNCELRICWADWVPPDRLFEKLLPAAWASTLTAARPMIQASSTHQRWSWHHPAIRARALS